MEEARLSGEKEPEKEKVKVKEPEKGKAKEQVVPQPQRREVEKEKTCANYAGQDLKGECLLVKVFIYTIFSSVYSVCGETH